MPKLSNEWIRTLYRRAETSGLFQHRQVLFSSLPTDVQSHLPSVAAPGPQFMSDLVSLNRFAANRPQPFVDWLHLGVTLAMPFGPAPEFEQAIQLLSAPAQPAPIAPDPQPGPQQDERAHTEALRALVELLGRMFSAEELRRFLRYEFPDIVDDLPSNGSLRQFVHDAVEALEQRGEIGQRLFDALKQERPRRVAEIDAVAANLQP